MIRELLNPFLIAICLAACERTAEVLPPDPSSEPDVGSFQVHPNDLKSTPPDGLHLGKFNAITKENDPGATHEIDFSVYLPPTYDADENWPVIVFLHGSGVRGAKAEIVQAKGVGIMIAEGEHLPFILVFPQCPPERTWKDERIMNSVVSTIQKVSNTCKVDKNRIYLTGNSLGGIGTWALANHAPEVFAAVSPLSGYADFDDTSNLKGLPIWAFHGGLDDIISIELAEKTIERVQKHNNNVQLTIYPKEGHRPWKRIYKDPSFYSWLLKHRKGEQDAADQLPARSESEAE